MSVYIPNMEIPRKRCEAIIFVHKDGSAYIALSPEEGEIGYFREYPLVQVPEHGDLIERDALGVLSWNAEDEGDFEDGVLFVLDKLEELPVVIPCDQVKEEIE